MPLLVEQFMCRSDNFGVLLHDPETGQTAIIDAPEEGPILAAIERTGWTPTHIFTTHHHPDHVEANLALKDRYKLQIIGPVNEADKIPGIDKRVGDGDVFEFSGHKVHVIETPGHTAGHICFYIPDAKLLFAADTLFAMGCGRLFERGPAEMYASFQKLMKLPLDTIVYCGHEYTQSNARFALTVDPENAALRERATRVDQLRADDLPTLPTTILEEMATNPYMRTHDASIRRHLGMENASDADVFAEIRKRKDNF